MVAKIVPNLAAGLPEDYLEILNKIRTNVEDFTTKSDFTEFTDHSIKHSDQLIVNIERFVDEFSINLNQDEKFILIASVYLHDIGYYAGQEIIDKKIQFPFPVSLENIKKNHSLISSEVIKNVELQKNIGFEISFVDQDLIELIGKVCFSHSNISLIQQLKQEIDIRGNVSRPRLMCALLYLGADLHVGRSRVILENLPKKQASIKTRTFWYSYSCIETVEINKSTITLIYGKSPKIPQKDFEEYILQPLTDYFQKNLLKINELLSVYGVSPIKYKYRIVESRLHDTDTTITYLTTAIIESRIRSRNDKRIKLIENKIKKEGLIKTKKIDNELIILRRWSSYTPRMPQWNQSVEGNSIPYPSESRGGGYFLIWNGIGIAIDPGYDFLRNLWTLEIPNGNYFELNDLDCAFISHAHDDHCHDIEPLISLLYKQRKLTRDKKIFHMYSSEGVRIKYERLLSVNDFIKVTDLVSGGVPESLEDNEKFLSKKNIRLEFLKTRHNETPWLKNHTGVAIKIRLSNDYEEFSVGFTSDTQYFDGLVSFFKDVDLLMVHFGNIGPVFGATPSYDKNHLGLNGCHDLIANLMNEGPKLFLMDEFGEEEIGSDRINVCDLISQLTNLSSTNKKLLPMDIGLRVKLPSLDIFCQEHRHFVPFNEISPHQNPNNDQILYFCK